MASFEVLKELYRGRSSAVFYASHCASSTPVALKLYKKRRLSTLNRCAAARGAVVLLAAS
jgi:aurora kinase